MSRKRRLTVGEKIARNLARRETDPSVTLFDGVDLRGGELALDGWRRRHKGTVSRSAKQSSHGKTPLEYGEEVPSDVPRCFVCYAPMVRSYPIDKAHAAASALPAGVKSDENMVVMLQAMSKAEPGTEVYTTAEELFVKARDKAAEAREKHAEAAAEDMLSALSRRKRKDALTCSPACRTILYKMRKLPPERLEAEVMRLLEIAERRGLWKAE